MPIYEYECSKCGRIDEVIQKFSDKPLMTCKHCSGKLHKLISQSSFHLKGTGWYVTDYANASRTSATSPKKAEDVKKSVTDKSKSKPEESKKNTDKIS